MVSNRRYPYALTLAALLLTPGNVAISHAADVDVGGSMAIELRMFPGPASYNGQDKSRISPAVVAEPEFIYGLNGGDDVLTFTPHVQFDANDERRSHIDVRELTWVHLDSNWDSTVGIGKVFWGVTESRHLVDIINQTDAVDGTDGEDKLGQPLVNATLISDWGSFGMFVLPGFRERTFADDEARLRGPKIIQADDATYDSSAENKHIDVALRWSHSIGDVDIGVSQFHGTSREPVMKSITRADGVSVFQPHYDIIDQTGLDAQLTSGSWLWKFESIGRAGQGGRFAAAVAGFEYTFYQVANTQADIGVLAEYLYDGRDKNAPVTFANNDIFVGGRMTLNDENDSSVLFGGVIDRISQETTVSFEAETRLTDHWKANMEARWFVNVPDGGIFGGIKNDDVVMMRLARYF